MDSLKYLGISACLSNQGGRLCEGVRNDRRGNTIGLFKRTFNLDAGKGRYTCIGWIVFGLIVGVVAKLLMPGRDPGGMFVTILLGITGALIGGFIGRGLGWYGESDPVGFIMAVIGSILVLFAYRKMSGSSKVGG